MKKNIILWLFLLPLFALCPAAQTPSQYQYWIDSSDALRQGLLQNGEFRETIDFSAYPDGLHLFTFRASDSEGRWSAPRTSVILKNSSTKATGVSEIEYWIDDISRRQSARLSGEGIFTTEIDFSTLTDGLHLFSYRATDNKGRWSAPRTSVILKNSETESITAYQYWYNRAGVPTTVELGSPASSPYELAAVLPFESADESREEVYRWTADDGHKEIRYLNRVHLRFRDSKGSWSEIQTDTFGVALGNEAVNFSGLIVNPKAESGREGWTLQGSVGNFVQNVRHYAGSGKPYFCLGNSSASSWESSMEQVVSDLPAGTYVLSVKNRAALDTEVKLWANDEYVDLPTYGEDGGEIWQDAAEGSAEKLVNDGKGYGWSRTSLIFTTDGNPVTIKATAKGPSKNTWADFVDFELFRRGDQRLTACFDSDVDMERYKGMTLVLSDSNTNIRLSVGTTKEYSFAGLNSESSYTLALVNSYGQKLWEKSGISPSCPTILIKDIKPIYDLIVTVTDPAGTDVTDSVSIEWYNDDVSIVDGKILRGAVDGCMLSFSISLGDSLGVIYTEPARQSFVVSASTMRQRHVLSELPKGRLRGRVYGEASPVAEAKVLVDQIVNGKYRCSTFSMATENGEVDMYVVDDTCSVTISAPRYFAKTIGLGKPGDMGRVDLDLIKTTAIMLDLQSVERTDVSEQPEPTRWMKGYNNLKVRAIKTDDGDEVVSQHQGSMLFVQNVSEGDELEVTVSDETGEYRSASCRFVYSTGSSMTATLVLTQLGAINVKALGSDNNSTTYMVFDSYGTYVDDRKVKGNGGVRFDKLPAGRYTVAAFGASDLLGTVGDLASLGQTGLKEGSDYVSAEIEVQDARMSELQLPFVSRLDESVFNFTSENCLFIPSKTQTIPGTYVTYTTRLEFKPQYASDIDDISLIFDLPEGMEYLENSAIVGSDIVSVGYDGHRLIIPLTRENYLQRVKFCLEPIEVGEAMTTACVKFNYDGERTQPIGRIAVDTKEFEIKVSETTPSTAIEISGTATPSAGIRIYDGDIVIGTTTAMLEGSWSIDCELNAPYNLSRHRIHAEIATASGRTYSTSYKMVTYNRYANRVKTVTMLNTAHRAGNLRPAEYRTVFDFVNPSQKSAVYWYWPKYPDFTFIVDFADNSPKNVGNVWLKVKTTSGSEEKVKASYDSIQNRWIATRPFVNAMPVNVSVKYDLLADSIVFDGEHLNSNFDNLVTNLNTRRKYYEDVLSIDNKVDSLLEINSNISFGDYRTFLNDHGLDAEVDPTSKYDPERLDQYCELLKIDDETVYKQRITEFFKDVFIDDLDVNDDLLRENLSTTDLLINGEEVILDSCAYTLRLLVPGDTSVQIDDTYTIVKMDNGDQVYTKLSETEFLIVNVSQGYMLSQRWIGSFEDSPEVRMLAMHKALYVADWFNSFLSKCKSLLDEAIQKIKDSISLDKIVEFVKEESKKKISKLIASVSSDIEMNKQAINMNIFGDHPNTQDRNIKRLQENIKNLEKKLKNLRYLESLLAGVDFIGELSTIYDQSVSLGECVTNLWLVPKQIERYKREIIDCLGETEAAPYLEKLDNFEANVCSQIKAYLLPASIMLLREVGKAYLSIRKVAQVPGDKIGDFVNTMVKTIENGNVPKFLSFNIGMEIDRRLADINSLLSDGGRSIRRKVTPDMCKKDSDDDQDDDQDDPLQTPITDPSDPWNPDYLPSMCRIEEGKEPNATFVADPSGFVYEAVTSNRLSGVTATVYEKSDTATPWNAKDYLQINPQITDESGLYAWDVPEGDWQVRFVKEGYEPAATKWLHVLPPQLDVNIPMYHAVSPKVKKAKGNPDGITITFDKYMKPETITGKELSAMRGSEDIRITLDYPDIEEDPNTSMSFVSKVVLTAVRPFPIGEMIDIHIAREAMSYADIKMAADTTLHVLIEAEITGLFAEETIEVAPGSTKTIEVFAEPAEAAAGRYLLIDGESALFSLSDRRVKFDAAGHARFDVEGRILGCSPVLLSVEEQEVECVTAIRVAHLETEVRKPKASLHSGTYVKAGTPVALYCDTEGATIYYTVDGSCPCDSETRTRYIGPIIIDRDMTIRAQAEKDGLDASPVATFDYKLEDSSVSGPVVPSADVVVENGAIVVRNCNATSCEIFNAAGIKIWSRTDLYGEVRVPVTGGPVFIVRTVGPDGHVSATTVIVN